MSERYYVGVDVGTGSVRAALVRRNGEICKVSTRDIKTWNPARDFYEQSSNDIWTSCCKAVKEVVASVNPAHVKGIGFDATCSMVVVGEDGEPLSVSPTGEKEQNVILWMDHRAKTEAEVVNRLNPAVLKYTGGVISVEMQTPKLMWLKANAKETWNSAKYFFDLADFLTWRATGDDSRSLCTVVCKWTFANGSDGEKGWNEDFFREIGLGELLRDGAAKIGRRVKPPGEKCGSGLLPTAARELGLPTGTAVAAGIIDAHAGGLGLLGSSAVDVSPDLESRIGLICGTSTCHMVVSRNAAFVPGVWGPYYGAMVPDMWLTEAGQSATGKLLDHVVDTHPATPGIQSKINGKMHVHQYLNDLLRSMAASKGLASPSRLTARLHVWPDFHGNRSPLADPDLRGMVSGLSLAVDEEDLAVKYLAAMQALAYGTRHIVDHLRRNGLNELSTVLMCGGLSKNDAFVRCHADVLGLPVLVPEASEPVLLGAAMLGAVASGDRVRVRDAVASMSGNASVFLPNDRDARYHAKKYDVFLKMLRDVRSYDETMSEFA